MVKGEDDLPDLLCRLVTQGLSTLDEAAEPVAAASSRRRAAR
jgi:hypothetical protein